MALRKKKQAPANQEARWEDFDDETKVLLMPLDIEAYTIGYERLRRRLNKHDAQFDEGELGVVAGERTEHEGQCMLLANFILLDWEGAEDEDGKPLAYSPEEGTAMLKGDIDFFLFVLKKSAALAKEGKEELAEVKGKPSPATSGKRSGAGKRKSVA